MMGERKTYTIVITRLLHAHTPIQLAFIVNTISAMVVNISIMNIPRSHFLPSVAPMAFVTPAAGYEPEDLNRMWKPGCVLQLYKPQGLGSEAHQSQAATVLTVRPAQITKTMWLQTLGF